MLVVGPLGVLPLIRRVRQARLVVCCTTLAAPLANGAPGLLPILLPYPPTMGNKSAFWGFSARRRPRPFRLETATEGNN